ncbi:hypothetical protein E2562_004946 [Oryza meyeriana var. granulata]|uniref:PGG domain-containing protein n=1 Tax=Oryza meyeriana var. granulata TaxID=110450 RepID=A0A6G1C461_9ORYZ|nr:hypothetical protein E2562_004946 [Oryza meyeriana var. granulata]
MSSSPSEYGDHASIVALAPKPQQLADTDPPATATGSTGSRRRGGIGLFSLRRDDSGVLLVVATLITTLSYQVGTNVPGGYWQDDHPGHHRAGEPIMRTQRRGMYRLFMWGSWIGFASSMGLTLALLTGMPPRSRFVRCLFVLAYSTLILTFITQQWQTFVCVSVLVWIAVGALIAAAVTYRTHHRLRGFINWLFGELDDQLS